MKFLATTVKALAFGLFLAAVGLVFPFIHLFLLNAVNLTLPFSFHLQGLILAGLAVVLAATFIQMVVPPGARSTVRAGLLAFGIFLWAETTLFIGNFGFLMGGEMDWGGNRHLLYLEILTSLFLIFLVVKARGFLLRRAGLVMILLTISAAANLYGPWRADQDRTKLDVRHTFTKKGVFDLSPERNVLIFILDTYQTDVFADIVAKNPSWRDVFDGFTYFPDATSAFSKTYASIPNILTGTAFDNSRPFPEYFHEAYLGNSVPRLLKRNGFDVRYHAFVWAPYLAHPDVADNLAGFDSPNEIRWMRERETTLMGNLMMFRLAPFVLKPWVYNDDQFRLRLPQAPDSESGKVGELAEDQRHYSLGNDHQDFAFLDEALAFLNSGSDRPTCRVYHLGGPHGPFLVDADMNFTGLREYAPSSFRDQSQASLILMKIIFDRLRMLGVYDNSLIVIAGDHGNGEMAILDIRTDALARLNGGAEAAVAEDPEFSGVIRGGIPLLLAKPPEADGPLRISEAPVELGDIPATVVETMGLNYEVPGRSLFDPDPAPGRTRLHRHYDFAGWGQDYIVPMTEYVVDGFSWDPGSWSKSDRNLIQAAVESAEGAMVVFGRGGNLADLSPVGWSEPHFQGRTIAGDSASIIIPVPDDAERTSILLILRQYSFDLPVPMRIYLDDELVAVVDAGGNSSNRHEILLPDGLPTPGAPTALRFAMDPGTNPQSQFVEIRLDYHAERHVWPLDSEIVFSQEGTGDRYLNYGWGGPEGWGTWSRGVRSVLSFSLDQPPRGDLLVQATLAAAIFGESPAIRAGVVVNGEIVADFESESRKAVDFEFRIPAELVPPSGSVDLGFLLENPRSPLQYGVSKDPRILGIGLETMTIREAGS